MRDLAMSIDVQELGSEPSGPALALEGMKEFSVLMQQMFYWVDVETGRDTMFNHVA